MAAADLPLTAPKGGTAMARIIMVGIAAGFAAALLFLAPVSGAGLAFPLFALTGLPIAIAGLGWGVLASGSSAVTGAVVVMALTQGAGAAIFILFFGAPMVWLTRLARLSRLVDQSQPGGRREWYPLGRLLFHAVMSMAVGLVLIGVATGYEPETIVREATAVLVDWLARGDPTGSPPTAAEIGPFVRLNVAVLPVTVAILAVAIVVVDLWLAALVARASGRLERPREKLWTVTLPNGALLGFAVATVLAMAPGVLGQSAAVFAGALGAAVALVGLAVWHALTLGMAGRGAVLAITYVLVFLFGLPVVLLVALGIGETFLQLRARRFGGAPPR